ncbi:MAG: carbonic anhydrase [Acidobacteriota bacterium]
MRKSIVTGFFILLVSVSAFAQKETSVLWDDMMAGNELFVKGQVVFGTLNSARRMWAKTQDPEVSILSCADSRVPPEILFGKSVGELFVVRVAGNVEDRYGIASLDFAIKNGWTKLIVIMGHSECGAVKAALPPSPVLPPPASPQLGALVTRIQKSFTGTPTLREATIANVRYTLVRLRAESPTIDEAIKSSKVDVVLAYYDVATGKVERIVD